MDDLQLLAAALTEPEPAREVVDRGRHQLQNAIGHPRHRRPVVRLAGGLGLTAAAAAVAVTLATSETTSTPAGSRPPAASPSARQILLLAATTAAAEHTGAYWHVAFTFKNSGRAFPGAIDSYQSWIARDGRYWNTPPGCATLSGTGVLDGPGFAGFSLGGGILTYQQTSQLPTDPAALTAWFARYSRAPSLIAGGLIALQYQVPAPSQVRAAAFRALAAFPDVRKLGAVPGGQGLLIAFPAEPGAGWIKLVVDPATGLVHSETNAKSVTSIQAARWTNKLPRIIPLSAAAHCSTGR